jgi:hypothetical protein
VGRESGLKGFFDNGSALIAITGDKGVEITF